MWRLKVINSCVHNDDLVLPVAPQPSVLQQFYTHWCDADEKCNKSANTFRSTRAHTTTAEKKRSKKRSYKAKRPSTHTTLSDWVNRIPHVALGRHTRLPESYRLRHPCASRLHCRVAYIADAATHKQVLSTYPSVRQTSEKLPTENDVIYVDSDGAGSDDITEEAQGVFSGPHYLILNCGSNPIYINTELLPCGQSRRLREKDIISFLENPFDEEGGVLEPLRPGDRTTGYLNRTEGNGRAGLRQMSPAIVDEGAVSWLLATSTARTLFTGVSGNGCGGSSPSNALLDLRASLLSGERREMQPFVEVNGVRVARRRLPHMPANMNGNISSTVDGVLSSRRGPSIAVEHNRLITTGESASMEVGLTSAVESTLNKSHFIYENHNGHLNGVTQWISEDAKKSVTPPSKSLRMAMPHFDQQAANAVNTSDFLHNGAFAYDDDDDDDDDNDGMDIVEDVVSPLQQRFVASPSCTPRNTTGMSTSPFGKSHAERFSRVPARLPVYVFARRSPSPQGFTRQAPSIGRLHTRSHTHVVEEEEEKEENEEKEEEDEEEGLHEKERREVDMDGDEENDERQKEEAQRKEKEGVGRDAVNVENGGEKNTAKELTRRIPSVAMKRKVPMGKRTKKKKAGTTKK